jgi:cell division septation protein DedD
MTKLPATRPSPRPPEKADALSPRDQALLRLERLMAENHAPEEAAEEAGPLIDVSELAETRPAAKPGPSARRHSRRADGPERPARRGLGLLGHVLQALIVLLVVVWVILLGVLVGRSRPEEKRLAGWLEKAVGWAQPRPAIQSPVAQIQPPPGLAQILAEPLPAPSDAPGRAEPEFNEPGGDTAVPEFGPTDLAGPAGEAGSAGEALADAAPEPLFAVQTTLARDETEARHLVAKLDAQGFTSYFYNNGRRCYIRVGPFPTRAEAEDNRRRLEGLGYKGPYVTKLRGD